MPQVTLRPKVETDKSLVVTEQVQMVITGHQAVEDILARMDLKTGILVMLLRILVLVVMAVTAVIRTVAETEEMAA
jgi:hypothetical protein